MGLALGPLQLSPTHSGNRLTRVGQLNVFIPDLYAEKKPWQGSADVAVSEIS